MMPQMMKAQWAHPNEEKFTTKGALEVQLQHRHLILNATTTVKRMIKVLGLFQTSRAPQALAIIDIHLQVLLTAQVLIILLQALDIPRALATVLKALAIATVQDYKALATATVQDQITQVLAIRLQALDTAQALAILQQVQVLATVLMTVRLGLRIWKCLHLSTILLSLTETQLMMRI